MPDFMKDEKYVQWLLIAAVYILLFFTGVVITHKIMEKKIAAGGGASQAKRPIGLNFGFYAACASFYCC
jgi:hypothetical protein